VRVLISENMFCTDALFDRTNGVCVSSHVRRTYSSTHTCPDGQCMCAQYCVGACNSSYTGRADGQIWAHFTKRVTAAALPASRMDCFRWLAGQGGAACLLRVMLSITRHWSDPHAGHAEHHQALVRPPARCL